MTEPEQFEEFVKAYQHLVYTTAFRLLGREAEAEDVAQDVFLKAYERFGELKESPSAAGWLRTVARNLSLNHLSRYRARWRFFSEIAADQDRGGAEPDWEAPDMHQEAVAAQDRKRVLEQALQRLPAAQRVPLVLYHFEDLGYEEIANRLGVSLSKIKTDIHRGREALRRKIMTHAAGKELEGVYGLSSPCVT